MHPENNGYKEGYDRSSIQGGTTGHYNRGDGTSGSYAPSYSQRENYNRLDSIFDEYEREIHKKNIEYIERKMKNAGKH